MRVPLLASASFLVSLAPRAALAQCTGFDTRFHTTGCNTIVETQIVFDDGTGPALFVGGYFTAAGSTTARGVAKWDGERWSALRGGIDPTTSGPSARVTSFAVYDDGGGPALYVGGEFASVDSGIPARSLARWNGANWTALTSELGLGARVYDMRVFDDGSGPALFVAGNFLDAGGITVNHVAKWDGTGWSSLAGGMSNVQPSVSTLEVYDDGTGPALYAGGGFTSAGGVPASRIAKWNGATWSALGSGADGYVLELGHFDAGGGGALYASGSFVTSGGVTTNGIARWDGASWSSLGSGLAFNRYIDDFEVYDDGSGPLLYAAGNFTAISGVTARNLVRFDGANWLPMPVEPEQFAYTLCTFDDGSGAGERLCVGTGEFIGGVYRSMPATWDGTQWADVGEPGASVPNGGFGPEIFEYDDGSGPVLLNYASSLSAGYAGLRKFDGITWSAFAAPNAPVNAFEMHDAGTGAELYVAGLFTAIDGIALNRIARRTAGGWAPLGSGLSGGDQIVLDLQSFDDGSGAALYACGRFQVAGGVSALRIARWNGASWSNVGDGFAGTPGGTGAVTMAVFDDGGGARLYAAGGFTTSGTATRNRIARWNGASWDGVGGGFDDDVHELAVFDDGSGEALYAAGAFTHAGGALARRIARWNGANWAEVGGGIEHGAFTEVISALVPFDDGSGPALHVAALDITAAGGVPMRGIVRWNGSAWSSLGVWNSYGPTALAAYDDPLGLGPSLFFGGAPIFAASTPSHHFGRWGRVCPCVASYCTAGTSSIGCAPSLAATGSPSATSATPFVVTASGVDGQKLGLLFYGLSGATNSSWGATSSVLCVKPPQQRTTQTNSGGTLGACDGNLVLDWNAYHAAHPGALGAPFAAGSTVWLQGWYRDPPSSKTTALTDALEAVVCPY